MSKWNWIDELEPPYKYNLLCALSNGTIRVFRRLNENPNSPYREVDTKNRLIGEERQMEEIVCWSSCKFVPHGRVPVTKFGLQKLEKKKANQEKYAALKRKVEEGS